MPAAPILAAVDFSRPSGVARDAAAALAKDLKARIVLVHAFGEQLDPSPDGATGRGIAVAAKAQKVEEAKRLTAEWAERLRAQGLDVEAVARDGAPATIILEEAKRHGCGMVVLGTAGRSGVRRWLLGSVAQAVLRHATLPVLVAPVRMAQAPPGGAAAARSLVVAVDFSADSEAAFEAGMRLAKDLRSGVRLVHVVEIPFTSATFPYSEAILSPEMLARDEEHAAAEVAQLASRARALDVGAIPSIEVGHPPSCILAAARSAGASLIVVGTHGRSGLRKFLLGSVAQGLVQMADRPVLVVPNRRADAPGGWLQ